MIAEETLFMRSVVGLCIVTIMKEKIEMIQVLKIIIEGSEYELNAKGLFMTSLKSMKIIA